MTNTTLRQNVKTELGGDEMNFELVSQKTATEMQPSS